MRSETCVVNLFSGPSIARVSLDTGQLGSIIICSGHTLAIKTQPGLTISSLHGKDTKRKYCCVRVECMQSC